MNKPLLSVITTSLAEQPSRIGTLAGGHGLAMLVASPDLPQHATPDLAQRMMSCSQAFKAQRCGTEIELQAASEAVTYLGNPAPRKWIAGRVASLLGHYFVSQQHEGLAAAVAEDWCAMLGDYPAWAIANACRWWMSRENPRKHCKPLPGDIQDRAHVEMEPVRAAKIMVSRGLAHAPASVTATAPEMVGPLQDDLARRREVAARLGLKTFGGNQ